MCVLPVRQKGASVRTQYMRYVLHHNPAMAPHSQQTAPGMAALVHACS